MKKKLLGLLLIFSVVKNSSAQDTLKLRLQDAMDAAIKNNKEIALAALDQDNAIAKFKQANAVFLPQVNLGYTAMISNNPLNAFGFKLQQQSVSPADFNPSLLNNPSATKNYMTKAEWNQPLLNLDMIYQRKAAKGQVDMYRHKLARTKEYMAYEVQKAYAQLQLAHQASAVLEEALHTVTAIFETTKNYYEKGYLQKSDLLLVQVHVISVESKLAGARSNVQNASDYLSLLMGVKSGSVYSVDSLEKTIHANRMETQVPESRTDLKALKAALQAQEAMINSEKMTYLPKLNGFANYLFNDKTAFGFSSNSYLVGAQLSWNIFNGTASYYKTAEQKIMHSKIALQLNYQKDQSQLELYKTLRQFQDAQYALQQHETSVKQAEEALRILENRFQKGLSSANDLLQSQSAFSEQKLLLSEAVFNYNTTLAYLKYLTSSENK